MCGFLEYGDGLRMRTRIGPILTTITTTGAGNTTRVTGIMMTTAITTIGTAIAIAIATTTATAARLYPGLGRKAGPCPKTLSAHPVL